MSLLNVEKISVENGHAELEQYLTSLPFVPLFYFSPYTLNTWVNSSVKSLYLTTYGEEKALLLYREIFRGKELKDVRFLFTFPSESFIQAVKEHFEPLYIAVNEIIETQSKPIPDVTKCELLIDLEDIASLREAKIRKDYNACIRKHPQLIFKIYTHERKADVFEFLEKWNTTRTEEQNAFAKTENDKRFLDLYSDDPSISGGIVLDNNTIIGITFFVPSIDGKAIGVISKCLRGYTQLGVYTFVERTRLMKAKGFSQAYIGTINNDFKKRFIEHGTLIPIKAELLFKDPELQLKFPERYLHSIL